MKTYTHFKDSEPYGYKERKPKGFNAINLDPEDIAELQTDISEWEMTSFKAKIVEPEFKVGETVYWDGGNRIHIIEKVIVDSEQIILQDVIGPLPFSVISHYYEGQNDIEFQHVRGIEDTVEVGGFGGVRILWQPVEEPKESEYYNGQEDMYYKEDFDEAKDKFQYQIDKKEIQLIEPKYLK